MEHSNETPTEPPPKTDRAKFNEEFEASLPQSPEEWDRYREEVSQVAARVVKKAQEEERLEKIAEEQAALDKIVFNLTRAFEEPPPSSFCEFTEVLDRNARILNAGFEYYLDRAAESPKGDLKVRLAIQMQSQLVRTIDAWRRMQNFQERQRK